MMKPLQVYVKRPRRPPQPPRYLPPTPHPEDGGDEEGGGDDVSKVLSKTPRDYFPPPTVVGLLEEEGATTMLSLLEQAGLLEELESGSGPPATLFAPTARALASLDREVIRAITEDLELMRNVMR